MRNPFVSILLFISVSISSVAIAGNNTDYRDHTSANQCTDLNGNDILDKPDIIATLISQSPSCSDAAQLARSCAWGSSQDVATASAAYGVCAKQLESLNPSQKALALLTTMKDLCNERYAQQQGTIFLSMNAYCHLNALEWIVNVELPPDTE